MRALAGLLACLAIGVAAQAGSPAQPVLGPAGDGRRPIIVTSLSGLTAPAPTVEPSHALSIPLDTEMLRLSRSIDNQQKSLEQLQKQLEDGLKQKQRLTLAQKLMTAIISLHRAERVLAVVHRRVLKAKSNIKKFGSTADEISDAIKRSEKDHQKELVSMNKKMSKLRTNLSEQEKALADLVGRRERIAGTVRKWRQHVAMLRDAHEASLRGGIPNLRKPGDDIQDPPSADLDLTMATLGLLSARKKKFNPFLGLTDLPPSMKTPNLNLYLKAKKANPGSATAALADVESVVAKMTGRGRFADEGAAEGAESAAGHDSEEQVDEAESKEEGDKDTSNEAASSAEQLAPPHFLEEDLEEDADSEEAEVPPMRSLRGARAL